jgi:hypothetical protein
LKVSALQSFLGWVGENNSDLVFGLANLETRMLNRSIADTPIDRPIFICGLARAGTTILLELMARHPDTATFRYQDYPFPMLPIWWDKMNGASDRAPVERSHKDGITVTPKSPEAMEEMVWMHFFPDCHDPRISNVIENADAAPEFSDFYHSMITKLLHARGKARYLAKNNYNITRLKFLAKEFPTSRFVVPVRDPVWQIASLMKQHTLFSNSDPRARAYLRRASHFEFGQDRRPINVGDGTTDHILSLWEQGKEVEGWAKYWASVNGYLREVLESDKDLAKRVLIVGYEDLCLSPEDGLKQIFQHVGLDADAEFVKRLGWRLQAPSYYNPEFSESEIALIKDATRSALIKPSTLAS